MKQCTKCGIEKSLDEFSNCKKHYDGLDYTCKQCKNNYLKQWYNDNKDEHTKSVIKYVKTLKSKSLPSVYKITNKINGRQYVGKTERTIRRKYEHFAIHKSDKSQSYNELLQADIKQYGKHNFKFEIIEHCEINQLKEREQYWIDTLQPYYNIRLKTQLETLKTTN